MITESDLPDTIAIFPLSGALLLLRLAAAAAHLETALNLQMIEELPEKRRDGLIGMVQPNVVAGPAKARDRRPSVAQRRITQSSLKQRTGRYMITLAGMFGRFIVW